jgi:hypothetical protein
VIVFAHPVDDKPYEATFTVHPEKANGKVTVTPPCGRGRPLS